MEAALARLNERERQAYNVFCKGVQPEISPTTQASMFGLFIQGKDCEAIRVLNPSYGLGQIAHAAVVGEWYKRREEYVQNLLDGVYARVQHTSLESIDYVCDWLCAHHKLNGEKLKRFFLTGNASELDGVPGSLKHYIDTVNLLRALTGQDKNKEVGTQYISSSKAAPAQTAEVIEAPKGLNPIENDSHTKIIEALEALDKVVKK